MQLEVFLFRGVLVCLFNNYTTIETKCVAFKFYLTCKALTVFTFLITVHVLLSYCVVNAFLLKSDILYFYHFSDIDNYQGHVS